MVRRPGSALGLAFVGGIDLCHGRRDDARYEGGPQTPPLDKRYGAAPPWHDAPPSLRRQDSTIGWRSHLPADHGGWAAVRT